MQLAEAFVRITAKTDEWRRGVAEIQSETTKLTQSVSEKLEATSKKFEAVGSKLKGVGTKMSAAITLPIVGAGVASFKLAADLEDALGATDQIFKGSSNTMKEWADGLETYYGIAHGEALEYSNMMGTMLMNIGGLSEEEAAKQAQTLIELAGDLTAMYGGTTSDAVRALTGALKGNNTMLDNYGMAANDALVKTKAMEMGLIGEKEELSLAAKQAATLALIMEQSGAAQGQAAREADGASGSMRALMTEIKNLASSIGDILLPIITPLLGKVNEWAQKFKELSPETQKTIVMIAGIAAAIGPVVLVVGTFVSAIGSIVGAFAAASGAIAAAGGVIAALTGPVGITIAAIAALIAIGVLLYKNWDAIKVKTADIWNSIKNSLSNTWSSISSVASSVWNRIKESIISPIRSAQNTLNGIIRSIQNAFTNMRITIPKPKLPHINVTTKYKSVGDIRVPYPSFNVKMYAKGTKFHPGGWAVVGEEGPELLKLPTGSQVLPNNKLNEAGGQGGETVITGNNFYIREESDIEKVARELERLRRDKTRGRGLAFA